MRRADRFASLPALLMLAGCGGGETAPAGNVASPTPAPSATPAPPATIVSTVPDRLTVTTNEPFYMVSIDRDVVTLRGVDLPERGVPLVGRSVQADARTWQAAGAGKALAIRVARAACVDDMSGAPRDFTATLTIDGRTVRGCGYVGTPSPPPGEPAPGHIPAPFLGRWNRDAAACADPAASIEDVRVTPGELWFHESVGAVKRVEPLGTDQVRITAAYDGEGERWTTTQTLRVAGDRLTIVTDGQPFSRIRCPG